MSKVYKWLTAISVVALLALLGSWPSAQDQTYSAPRFPGTGQPDLNGIWQAVGTAHWNIEDHIAQAGPILELGAIGAIPAGHGPLFAIIN